MGVLLAGLIHSLGISFRSFYNGQLLSDTRSSRLIGINTSQAFKSMNSTSLITLVIDCTINQKTTIAHIIDTHTIAFIKLKSINSYIIING